MKPLFILAQTNSGAVILMIVLLIVAGIIGYFTAWFYAKSVYTPVIQGLETEKADLLKQVAELQKQLEGLKADLAALKVRVDNQSEKIKKLESETTIKDMELVKFKKPIK
jgi:peptidoglycan hydrolase CwlO-like protein